MPSKGHPRLTGQLGLDQCHSPPYSLDWGFLDHQRQCPFMKSTSCPHTLFKGSRTQLLTSWKRRGDGESGGGEVMLRSREKHGWGGGGARAGRGVSRKGRELPQRRAAQGLCARSPKWQSFSGDFDDLAFLVAQLGKNLPAMQETLV